MPFLSWMDKRKWDINFCSPPLSSSNRDKLHFSRSEVINTLWILLILWWWCGCDGGCEGGALGGDEGGGEIEWKQKNKSEHGT